jgi:hypothetical protein
VNSDQYDRLADKLYAAVISDVLDAAGPTQPGPRRACDPLLGSRRARREGSDDAGRGAGRG